jgi:hypothetical protein
MSHRTKTKTPTPYRRLGQLTVCNVITINNLICLMICVLKHRAQLHLVWNNALPHIRKPPHNRRLSPISRRKLVVTARERNLSNYRRITLIWIFKKYDLGVEGRGLGDLAGDKGRWRAVVNAVMNRRIFQRSVYFVELHSFTVVSRIFLRMWLNSINMLATSWNLFLCFWRN